MITPKKLRRIRGKKGRGAVCLAALISTSSAADRNIGGKYSVGLKSWTNWGRDLKAKGGTSIHATAWDSSKEEKKKRSIVRGGGNQRNHRNTNISWLLGKRKRGLKEKSYLKIHNQKAPAKENKQKLKRRKKEDVGSQYFEFSKLTLKKAGRPEERTGDVRGTRKNNETTKKRNLFQSYIICSHARRDREKGGREQSLVLLQT